MEKNTISTQLKEKRDETQTRDSSLSQIFDLTCEYPFFITNKIEKVKELLIYEDLNITEIADKLHFSSVAHLSNLFKKITGITPSQYRQLCFFDQKPPKKKTNNNLINS